MPSVPLTFSDFSIPPAASIRTGAPVRPETARTLSRVALHALARRTTRTIRHIVQHNVNPGLLVSTEPPDEQTARTRWVLGPFVGKVAVSVWLQAKRPKGEEGTAAVSLKLTRVSDAEEIATSELELLVRPTEVDAGVRYLPQLAYTVPYVGDPAAHLDASGHGGELVELLVDAVDVRVLAVGVVELPVDEV